MDTSTTHQRAESYVDQQTPAACSYALDEAFADLPPKMRVDQPASPQAKAPSKENAEELVGKISTQLRSIELQRARLEKLLKEFNF